MNAPRYKKVILRPVLLTDVILNYDTRKWKRNAIFMNYEIFWENTWLIKNDVYNKITKNISYCCSLIIMIDILYNVYSSICLFLSSPHHMNKTLSSWKNFNKERLWKYYSVAHVVRICSCLLLGAINRLSQSKKNKWIIFLKYRSRLLSKFIA